MHAALGKTDPAAETRTQPSIISGLAPTKSQLSALVMTKRSAKTYVSRLSGLLISSSSKIRASPSCDLVQLRTPSAASRLLACAGNKIFWGGIDLVMVAYREEEGNPEEMDVRWQSPTPADCTQHVSHANRRG